MEEEISCLLDCKSAKRIGRYVRGLLRRESKMMGYRKIPRIREILSEPRKIFLEASQHPTLARMMLFFLIDSSAAARKNILRACSDKERVKSFFSYLRALTEMIITSDFYTSNSREIATLYVQAAETKWKHGIEVLKRSDMTKCNLNDIKSYRGVVPYHQ